MAVSDMTNGDGKTKDDSSSKKCKMKKNTQLAHYSLQTKNIFTTDLQAILWQKNSPKSLMPIASTIQFFHNGKKSRYYKLDL